MLNKFQIKSKKVIVKNFHEGDLELERDTEGRAGDKRN